ncbi:MAG: transcription termination factor NusA [Verrucomicrobia bacterium]|jgi:transcription termination/antitermination protein NusA|nr:transcription termination factor NusA [Verrucomicrobiota bacterium]MDA1203499.1 transcription termination factor NusA [Verrucomicrobiota bacterium]
MSNELLTMLEYLERERGISRDTLLQAMQEAIIKAAGKGFGGYTRELRVEISPKTGKICGVANVLVVDKVANPQEEMLLARAQVIKPGVELGDSLEVEVEPAAFGRIAAGVARNAIMSSIRRVEKERIYEEFKDRAGDIVSGTVRRFIKSDVIFDLGKFEAVMPSRERVVTEDYSVGDRLRAYVVAVENGKDGPQIILSRSHPNFVRKLFQLEVSEIADGTVQLKGIAREAGVRTKVAVASVDSKVDPVGACVGMRGARVKNIVRELNNEKVDIIKWSDDPKEFVVEALKPAKIKSIEINEVDKRVKVCVDEDQLSIAIGKKGQNARLTAKLTGWEVDIEKDASKEQAFENQVSSATAAFKTQLGLDEETAAKLVQNGIPSPQDLVAGGVEAADLVGMLGIDEAKAAEIVERAKGLEAKKSEPVAPAPAEEAAAE